MDRLQCSDLSLFRIYQPSQHSLKWHKPLFYILVCTGKPHVYLVKFSSEQHSVSCSHLFKTIPHKQIILGLSKTECSVKATYIACAKSGFFPEIVPDISHDGKTFELLISCPETKQGKYCRSKIIRSRWEIVFRFFHNFYLWAEKSCHPVRELFWKVMSH